MPQRTRASRSSVRSRTARVLEMWCSGTQGSRSLQARKARYCSKVKLLSPSSTLARCVARPSTTTPGRARRASASATASSGSTPNRFSPVSTFTWTKTSLPASRAADESASPSASDATVTRRSFATRRRGGAGALVPRANNRAPPPAPGPTPAPALARTPRAGTKSALDPARRLEAEGDLRAAADAYVAVAAQGGSDRGEATLGAARLLLELEQPADVRVPPAPL